MAAEIKQKLGITAEYIKSGNGKFEIVSKGKLLYSKKATGKFPAINDIIEKLRSMQ
ncbi:Rdx family protein [candidate division KSB1 bacterium]|nr:Rdx family protein [candidate division KSB1 bacterium]MCH8285468.1 Rdx family protein [candidate division KSB1 bacterium]